MSNICPKASCQLKRRHSRFTAMMCRDSVMDEHAHLHSQAANISAGMLVEAVGAVVLKGYESGFTDVRVHSGQRRRDSKRKNEGASVVTVIACQFKGVQEYCISTRFESMQDHGKEY